MTEADVFTRFNETEQLINRLYFYVRAADQPLVHIRFFSDSTLADECEGSSAENGWSNKFNEGDWEPGAQIYTSCNATTNAGACHTFWPALYQDIRCANVILEGIEKIQHARFRRYTSNNPDNVSVKSIFCAPTCTTAC